VRASVKFTTVPNLAGASPLLEEKPDTSNETLITYAANPAGFEWSCPGTAFTCNDDPMNAS
jgi:hypothetical protein